MTSARELRGSWKRVSSNWLCLSRPAEDPLAKPLTNGRATASCKSVDREANNVREGREERWVMIRRICFGMLVVLSVWVLIRTKATAHSAGGQSVEKPTIATCPVTLPGSAREFGKRTPGSEAMSLFEQGASRRKPMLIVGPFGLWPNGTIVFQTGGPGSIEPDGSLAMKFGWTREGLRGKLKIHGKRLDAPAPPLRASIPYGYGDTGFQATALIFPTEGCWEVTGEVGDTHVTFVTRVVRIKEPEPQSQ